MYGVVANLLQTRRQEVRIFHANYERTPSILKQTPEVQSERIEKAEGRTLEADIVQDVKRLHDEWMGERLWERRPLGAKPSERKGQEGGFVPSGEEEGALSVFHKNWKLRRLIMSPLLILGFIALSVFANKRRIGF